jgi:hypothetical protein
MLMRFTIEQRLITDSSGRVIANDASPVSFHTLEAESPDDAVRLFLNEHSAEIIGNVVKYPGFQAVATVRNPNGVYTLQVTPSSQKNIPIG